MRRNDLFETPILLSQHLEGSLQAWRENLLMKLHGYVPRWREGGRVTEIKGLKAQPPGQGTPRRLGRYTLRAEVGDGPLVASEIK